MMRFQVILFLLSLSLYVNCGTEWIYVRSQTKAYKDLNFYYDEKFHGILVFSLREIKNDEYVFLDFSGSRWDTPYVEIDAKAGKAYSFPIGSGTLPLIRVRVNNWTQFDFLHKNFNNITINNGKVFEIRLSSDYRGRLFIISGEFDVSEYIEKYSDTEGVLMKLTRENFSR